MTTGLKLALSALGLAVGVALAAPSDASAADFGKAPTSADILYKGGTKLVSEINSGSGGGGTGGNGGGHQEARQNHK
jgi:hypothetical protein